MKRILILCLLGIIAFGNVEAARADAFGFGAAVFDDQKTMMENLQSLLPPGGPHLQSIGSEALMGMGTAYVALIGVSQEVVGTTSGDSFQIMYDGGALLQSYLPTSYWHADPLSLDKITLSWQLSSDPGTFPVVSLNDLITGAYPGVVASGAYFYGDELVYQPDGYTPISLSGGTIFIGLDLGYGNKVDAIVAFSYSPINAVPVPAAFWLLGSGVAGIVAMRKRIN